MTKTAKILTLISLVTAAQIAASAATQTIAFDAIPNQIFGVPPFPTVAQASSGLPVTFVSTTPAVCKTSGSLVMLLSAGPCFITASQAGNGTYDAATSVTQSFTVSQGKPAASFEFLNPPTVATRPYAITVGDFNNDGIPDMATVSLGGIGSQVGAVTVLIGNGMGGFTATAGSPISVGQFPVSIVTGDFNADGNADLAVANANDGTVTVLLGNGAGAFSPALGSPFATDAGPWSIVVGDFNGDGIEDLATANQGGNDVTILLGNGLGGFVPAAGTPPAVETAPLSMVVADFNADGFQDLAIGNGFTISVLLGNGSGGFAAATGSPFTLEALALAVGDFNGDGIPDLAAANIRFDSTVSVYIGNGAGGFAPASGSPFSVGSFPMGIETTSVTVGDFNGDGFADIAVGLYYGNAVTVLAGNGSGGFTAGGSFGVFFFEQAPIALATGDFNRDGMEDFAVAYQQNSLAAVWLGWSSVSTTSVLSTTSPLTIDAGQSVSLSVAVSYPSVDFSAFTGTVTFLDGTTVLGTSSQTASPYLFTATGLGVGSHTLTATYSGDSRSQTSTSNSLAIQVVTPATQSITFNALPDVPFSNAPISLTATASSGLPVALTSNTLPVCTVSGNNVTLVTTGSCSITASQIGNVYYSAALTVTQAFNINQANQTIAFDAIPNQLFGISPFPIAVATASVLPISIASGTPAVCTTVTNMVSLVKPGTCSITASQNGNSDYIAATPVTRAFAVSNATGAITYAAASGSPIAAGTGPYTVLTADFNNDGAPDIVWANTNLTSLSVALGDGHGAFIPAKNSPFSLGAVSAGVVVGDFNGDGFQDIAAATAGNNIVLLLGDGIGGFSPASGSPFAAGNEPLSLVAGDFNGDGALDLAVSNAGDGSLTVLLGNGAGGFILGAGGTISSAFGSRLVVADFNSDGFQDLAAVNSINGTFTILLGNNAGGFSAAGSMVFPVGAYDALAVGDFNNDGNQDLAVTQLDEGVLVYFGNGRGGFTPASGNPFPVGSVPVSITAGDFNGDGIQDLAVANQFDNNITLLLGNGAGSFTTSTVGAVNTGTWPVSLAVADLDGDGIEDLITANNKDSNLTVLLGQPIGTTPQTITFAPLSNIPVATASFALAATSDSGLTVAFTSNTPAVCTVSGATLTILTAGGCSITATQPGSTVYAAAIPVTQSFTVLFSDLAPTDLGYAEINTFAQLGITNGCGSNNFCPNENVTRDQMAIFIVRAIYGSDNFTYTATPYFTDVTPATFGFKWIQKLKDLGITTGCTTTTYCPGDVVTRDEMAIFIIRARLGVNVAGPTPAFTYPSTPYFTDATAANEFAFPWIQRMRLENITSGCTTTTYCSTDPVTRGEMAIFIMRGAFNQYLPAGTPVITQISPSAIAAGTSGTYTITGVNTNFVQGTTQLSPIPGLAIGAIGVTSPTTMTVQLSNAGGVAAQPYSLLVITGSEQAVLPNGLALQ